MKKASNSIRQNTGWLLLGCVFVLLIAFTLWSEDVYVEGANTYGVNILCVADDDETPIPGLWLKLQYEDGHECIVVSGSDGMAQNLDYGRKDKTYSIYNFRQKRLRYAAEYYKKDAAGDWVPMESGEKFREHPIYSDDSPNYKIKMYSDPSFSIDVFAYWRDSDDEARERPTEKEVTLLGDGEPVKTITLSKDGGWKDAFYDLKTKNENGQWIDYRLQQIEPFDKYTSYVSRPEAAESGRIDIEFYYDIPVYDPRVKTRAKVLSYSNDSVSTSSDDSPAVGKAIELSFLDYDEYNRIEEQQDNIFTEVDAIAAREAKAMARELVKAGRYKESLSEKDVHIDRKKYPHLTKFFFNWRDGEKYGYTYSFYVDLSSIDYSNANVTLMENQFKITDEIEITGLNPEHFYHPTIELLKINDDGSTTEIDSTDMTWSKKDEEPYRYFSPDEEGNAKIYADFDYVKLDEGKYVLTAQFTDNQADDPTARGGESFSHEDLNDVMETFIVSKDIDDEDAYWALEDTTGFEWTDTGVLAISSGGGASSPSTGDRQLLLTVMLTMFLLNLILIAYLVSCKVKQVRRYK